MVANARFMNQEHGSAPDITGMGIVNPLGAIWSLAMAMPYSCVRESYAVLIKYAMRAVLKDGVRTAVIAGYHQSISTERMGDAMLVKLEALAMLSKASAWLVAACRHSTVDDDLGTGDEARFIRS